MTVSLFVCLIVLVYTCLLSCYELYNYSFV